jgi:hypothetical protein
MANEIKLKGKIVEVISGSKKLSSRNAYNYLSIRLMVDNEFYSVLYNYNNINKFGYIPKIGHWIKVKGILVKNKDTIYDKSIKWVSELKHIENPNG